MSNIPAYLQKGDTIGIVAPAGYMAVEKMQACIETLDHWGFTVRMGATTHSESHNYFSGTDDQRLADLQMMMDDAEVKAILCARGGYGTSRIIDRINFKKFRKSPKWIVGYSDITVLHSHLWANYRIPSLHAPMAAAFNDGQHNNSFVLSLNRALLGETQQYVVTGHHLNRPGKASGRLVGGNLSLLIHILGTRSEVNFKNRILFIEDIGEQRYNIDRMMLQLKRSGRLSRLAGLIVGGFSDTKDTERPFGMDVYEIIYDHVKEYRYPICFGFPVSHSKENVALKVGMEYDLLVQPDQVMLSE